MKIKAEVMVIAQAQMPQMACTLPRGRSGRTDSPT